MMYVYCVKLEMLTWNMLITRRTTRLTEWRTATVSFISSSSWLHSTSWWHWLTGTGKININSLIQLNWLPVLQRHSFLDQDLFLTISSRLAVHV